MTNFKPIEFDRFKAESGDNAFTLTPQQWIKATDAIGIVSKSGRYGGTYAHTNSCLEMLMERLSQRCGKMNRY